MTRCQRVVTSRGTSLQWKDMACRNGSVPLRTLQSFAVLVSDQILNHFVLRWSWQMLSNYPFSICPYVTTRPYTYICIYIYLIILIYIYTLCTFFSFRTSGSKVWKLHLLWWRCWRPSTMGWLRPLPGLQPSRMFIKIMEMWMFMCVCVCTYVSISIYICVCVCVCERERGCVCVYI
jgi:hypothetical protein